MTTELATTEAEERPDWIPEAVWPQVKSTLVLMKAKVDKRSMNAVAESFGLPANRMVALFRNGKWRQQLEEAREDFVQSNIVARYAMSDILHQKIADPAQVAKMSIKDVAIAQKALSDDTLNLANGMVGSPALQMNFTDIKALFTSAPVKPE